MTRRAALKAAPPAESRTQRPRELGTVAFKEPPPATPCLRCGRAVFKDQPHGNATYAGLAILVKLGLSVEALEGSLCPSCTNLLVAWLKRGHAKAAS